ncbi:MAG: BspA family leucine-rich repeat surface protein [Bacilli bacterium]|nr:BspA family leucine-rich repeat surface protein [Bacilli bacterium]
MKKIRRRKVRFDHEKRNLFIFLLFVFFMGMGYSVLGTNLGIGGSIVAKRYQDPVIKTTSSTDKTAFRSDTYREKIKVINLDDEINPPANVVVSWDIGVAQNGNVMAYLTTNQTDNNYYDLYIQGKGHLYAHSDSSYLFYNLRGVDVINGIEKLDTSRVENMSNMFSSTGYNSTSFTLNLGNNFDTNQVTNMQYMFNATGYSSTVFTLNLGGLFNTSKVTKMFGMFSNTGYSSTVFTLNLEAKFDTSKVTNMKQMFYRTGYSSTVFTLNLGEKFDTSQVTNMQSMFSYTGYSSTIFTLNLGEKFDTSKVTNMSNMFPFVGYSSMIFTLNLGEKFDTSQVTDMSYMFSYTDYSNTIFTLDLSPLTFNATSYDQIFNSWRTTQKIFVKDSTARSWIVTNSGNSNLTNSNVFIKTEYFMLDASYDGDYSYFRDNYRLEIKTITFSNSINPPNGYVDSWDISVGHYGGVMAYVVPNSSTPSMYDLHIQGDGHIYANTDSSYWFSRLYYVESINNINVLDTSLTVNMSYMFDGIGSAGDETSFSMDINFDTSHVTDMSYMFRDLGRGAISFTFGDKFDTSNVTDMEGMFCYYGYIIGMRVEADISAFTFNASSYYNMFGGWQSDYKIYVKDATAQNWILTHSGNSNLTTANVLIKT